MKGHMWYRTCGTELVYFLVQVVPGTHMFICCVPQNSIKIPQIAQPIVNFTQIQPPTGRGRR